MTFPAWDGSGLYVEPAAFPGLQPSRQTASHACESEVCLPGPTQVGMDGDQLSIRASHQAGQVSRRELEEAVTLTWKEEPGSGNVACSEITASPTG